MRKYPKIIQLGRPPSTMMGSAGIRMDEKVDGSCLVLVKDEHGNLTFSNKRGAECGEIFTPAIRYLQSIKDRIPSKRAYFMEVLNKQRHNQLTYDQVPQNGIYLFDVYDYEHLILLPSHAIQQTAEWLGIEGPNILFETSKPMDYNRIVEKAQSFIGAGSFLGGTEIEGVVIKDYTLPYKHGTTEYPFTAAKLVSDHFKEIQKQKPKGVKTDKLEEFKSSFCTEARWQKALQHLEEEGKLTGEDSDIGLLVRDVHQDIEAEDSEWIKNKLYSLLIKDIKKSAVYGLAHWYKCKLDYCEV